MTAQAFRRACFSERDSRYLSVWLVSYRSLIRVHEHDTVFHYRYSRPNMMNTLCFALLHYCSYVPQRSSAMDHLCSFNIIAFCLPRDKENPLRAQSVSSNFFRECICTVVSLITSIKIQRTYKSSLAGGPEVAAGKQTHRPPLNPAPQ